MIKRLLAKILCAFNIHPWEKFKKVPFSKEIYCRYCNKYLGRYWIQEG